jgi:hypothetical protein
MDALRNSKKISLLAVAILFLFTFFNLILDAPRTRRIVLTCDRNDDDRFVCNALLIQNTTKIFNQKSTNINKSDTMVAKPML